MGLAEVSVEDIGTGIGRPACPVGRVSAVIGQEQLCLIVGKRYKLFGLVLVNVGYVLWRIEQCLVEMEQVRWEQVR